MKTLIFTTCYGAEVNFKMTNAMIASLRVMGYDRDIIVLTDRKWSAQDKETRVVPVENPEGDILWKASLPEGIAKGYDVILCVDSDVRWVKSPDSLFDVIQDKMMAARINFRLKNDAYNKRFLTEKEAGLTTDGGLIEPQMKSVNAGVIGFPGDQYAVIAANWRAIWTGKKKPEAHVGDQPALQALMLRKQVSYAYFPDEMVVFPKFAKFKFPTENTVLAHFAGYPANDEGTEACIAAMASYPETVKEIHGNLMKRAAKGARIIALRERARVAQEAAEAAAEAAPAEEKVE